jgi:pimeloyl-ACP methyl ester carboxylesterase
MRAQVAQGNPSEALLVFEQLRVLLRDELGTVPSVAMSALHLWVLRQADPDLETITAEAGNEQGAASENQIVDPVPETLYVRKPDGINIAYQTVGDGPTDLVIVPGFMSHLDAQWTDPDYRAWLRQLTKSFRVISLDKAGSGASDPLPRPPSLAEWADDVRAVLDAVGSSKAILLGASEAGPVSIHFALSEPERVAGLILYGSFARVLPDPDYLWKHRGEIAEAVGRFTELGRSWGVGGSADIWAPGVATSDEERYAWAVFERASASPGSASYRSEAVGEIDVRDRLASLQVPTLVLHRRGDQLVLIHYGRYLGKAIPDARYVELPGSCHVPYLGEGDEVEIMLQTIEDFARDSATWNKAGMSPG